MRIREVAQSPNHRTFTAKTEYTNYRNKVKKEHRIIGRDNYNRMIHDYFSSIAELSVEHIGGVCVKGLFYIFMFKLPKKAIYRMGGRKIFNFHSNHYIYNVAIQFASRYSHWTIKKRTFLPTSKKQLELNIKDGVKYKAHFYSLKRAKYI